MNEEKIKSIKESAEKIAFCGYIKEFETSNQIEELELGLSLGIIGIFHHFENKEKELKNKIEFQNKIFKEQYIKFCNMRKLHRDIAFINGGEEVLDVWETTLFEIPDWEKITEEINKS